MTAHAQYFDLAKGKRKTLPFKLIRNLVVIQLKINNKGPFNFILDTGVGFVLITDPSLTDTLKLANNRTIKMSGFGEGEDFEAYITKPLAIEIPGLICHNISAAILKKDHFNLSTYTGTPIHGLIGYEFFSRLAVKISFSDSTITVARPKYMRMYKNATHIPLSIEDRKPYLTAKVVFANGTEKESKLVVDLGAGHFVSMENVANTTLLQNKLVRANLGIGIKGQIMGSVSRIKEITLGKYKMQNIISAFPDDDMHSLNIPRDGNLGMGLLRKFDIIFDYPDSVMYLHPASNFKAPSEHDMSGLAYYASGENYSHIIIYNVEPESAGDDIGLEKDDEIVSINFRPVDEMSLQQIDDIFKSKDKRVLVLMIYRDKKYQRVVMTLKRRV
ncbi:MAG: aspartyl protease family protein [Mucilaginibacter sp.]|nr:aspartyl protease family protein [Mucilaginibacter sp.]